MRFIIVITLAMYHATAASAGDDLSSTLKSEWAVLSALDDGDKCYVVDREVNLAKHKSNNRYDVNLTADCGRLQSAKVVLCWNSQYAFNLKKSKGDRPEEWLLGQLVVSPPSGNTLKQLMLTNGYDICYYKPLTAFFGSTCNQYLADGSLRVTDHILQGSLVRANFELKASFGGGETAKKEHFTGTMLMDPTAHYVVTEAVLSRKVLPPGMTEEGRHLQLTRTVEKTGETFTAISVNYGTGTGKDVSFHTLNRYSDYRFVVTDPKEFRVSNYGIPEPPEVTWERTTPRYVWFILAAAGFGAVATASGYFRRRAIRATVHSQTQS